MNLLRQLHKKYTYREIAERINEATGASYNHHSIGNVTRGFRPLSDKLLYRLMRAFPNEKILSDYQSVDKMLSPEHPANHTK